METTPLDAPNLLIQKEGGVFNKMEKKSLWSFCDLLRRLISDGHRAEVQREARGTERMLRIARAIRAAGLFTSTTMAGHLFIALQNLAKALDGSRATADILAGVVGLVGEDMAGKREIDVSRVPLLLLG